jgi:hypothetical protein
MQEGTELGSVPTTLFRRRFAPSAIEAGFAPKGSALASLFVAAYRIPANEGPMFLPISLRQRDP